MVRLKEIRELYNNLKWYDECRVRALLRWRKVDSSDIYDINISKVVRLVNRIEIDRFFESSSADTSSWCFNKMKLTCEDNVDTLYIIRVDVIVTAKFNTLKSRPLLNVC